MSYKAIIAKIDRVIPIEGADRIHTAVVFGEHVITTKEWNVGKVGIFFPVDTRLSHDFCKHNNLYRDSEKNLDTKKTGFFDDNRRVRAQPFMKVKSEGFFCEISALDYIRSKSIPTKIGSQFDEIERVKICEKYISPKTQKQLNEKNNKKKVQIDVPNFSKHVDTDQFKHNVHKIEKGSLISIHSKKHGTSFRCSNTKVIKKPKNFFHKLLMNIGILKKEEYSFLAGSRNVILHEEKHNHGFHGSNKFRFDILDELKPHLVKDMIVYGEIVGYVNGSPIMGKHNTDSLRDKKFKKKYGKEFSYSYGCKEHEFKFHIYRISIANDDIQVDLSDAQCKKWCKDRGFEYARSVCKQFIYDGNAEALMGLVEELTERPECLCEDYTDSSHISEGVVIRIDDGGLIPTFFKNKSFAF